MGAHDRFEILETLGAGGLGIVHRARDAASGGEVALKVMRAKGADDADGRLRFKQEFRAMTRLRHPNLCTVHDFGITPEGAPFFTMELVEGEDLAGMLPMAPQRLLEILPPLVRALGCLHRHGFVHGDVKPENVRLMPDGSVKLMDLGLLTAIGHAPPAPRGTLAYMAPEIIRGDRVDARADIYALGAMCYHLLAGRPPFAGATAIDVLRAHLTRRPRPLREVDEAIPPALDRVIARMMAREPVARVQSLGEVLAALGLEPDADEAAQPLTGAFIGRQAQLSAFTEALRELKRGRKGGALWLAGPMGAGKTRLLEELRVHAQLEEVPFLAAGRSDAPYGPFVAILRALGPAAREALAGAQPEQRRALGRLLPGLAADDAPAGLEPQEERIVLQSGIAHVLRAVGARTGAVLALDDWDRADAASVETLAYLRRNLADAGLLIVATGREAGYLDPSAETLPPLTAAETAALAASMMGAALPDELTGALFRLTGGHAGHAQRVVEHLARTGALRREGGRWVAPADLAASDLGADFRAVVEAPLAALTGPATQLAELTAVVGPGADLAVLVALAGLDEETVFAALDELVARRIVTTREGRVAFASGGLEDAVYGRIGEGRRLWLHAAAAAQLEPQLRPGDVAAHAALARHYVRSRQTAKALPAVLVAEELSRGVFAIDAARGLLRDGLALMEEEPDRYPRERRDHLLRLAAIERWRGDFEAMGACLEEALPLAESVGEPGPLAQLLVLQGAFHLQRMAPAALRQAIAVLSRALATDPGADPALAARARFFLGQAHLYLGEPAGARAAFEAGAAAATGFWQAKLGAFLGYMEATGEKAGREAGFARMAAAAETLRALGDRYGAGFALAQQGDALLGELRLAEALPVFEAQVAVAEELGVVEDLATGLANLAIVHALAGRFRAALAASERGVPLASQAGLPVGLLAEAVAGFAHAGLGDLRRAGEALAAVEAAGQAGAGYMFAHAVPFLLAGWLALGRPDEARRLAEEALFRFREHPDPVLRAQAQALLGEAHLLQGRQDLAREAADEAWREALAAETALGQILALRLRAHVAQASHRADEAEACAAQALALAERAGADGLAAQLNGVLAECALVTGRADAPGRFRAMQLHADREGLPMLRAAALYGQAQLETHPERADALRLEAQHIVRSLADGLEPLARQAFVASQPAARLLAERPAARAPLAAENGQHVFERVMALSLDLQGFATQYGALFRDWAAGNRQLEMLNALARRINETLDLDDVLPRVAAMTLELTGAERAFVLLADADGLRCRAALDRTGRAIPDARYSLTVCQRVLASGEPVAVLDATLSDALRDQASIADLNLRTLMCVPLTARGESRGVLYVDSQAVVTTFTRKDLDLLAAIAGHAGVAIANAALYAESRRREAELARALEMYRDAMHQANTDPLTGLNNRRCFDALAERELDATRRYGRHLTLLALDVDHFKAINDTHGHGTGDAVLKALAGAIASCARVCDVPARFGGEEFVVLCPETDLEGAVALGERIRRAVAGIRVEDEAGRPLRPITVSIGATAWEPAEPDLAAALARADEALYACKRGGRDQVRAWSPAVPVE